MRALAIPCLPCIFILIYSQGASNKDYNKSDNNVNDVCSEHNSYTTVNDDFLRKYSGSKPYRPSSVDAKEKHIPLISSFDDWRFAEKQLLAETFPIDPEPTNYIRQVKNALFSVAHPTPFNTSVKLATVSHDALTDILDLDPVVTSSDFFVDFISGNIVLANSTPLAHRYGGHKYQVGDLKQFGDGRAVMLGEYVNRKGERWELQLKGSGQTPYSRRKSEDCRAVLRSSVREFLLSEAMYHLGIPTTRALSLVVTNDLVRRDIFFDGNPIQERAAVVLRLAPSWFRVSSLEILAHDGENNLLRQLTDFIIEKYFTKIDPHDKNRYVAFFADMISQTAEFVAQWMSFGFAHGVPRTDNFSILSLTIDYGPFGFLDSYIPSFIPNKCDNVGRFSYEKQPDVGYFNLDQLRAALLPILDHDQQEQAIQLLSNYTNIYKNKFLEAFRAKLGLLGMEQEDDELVAALLQIMQNTKADFTMTFRQLGELPLMQTNDSFIIPDSLWALQKLKQHKKFLHWLNLYRERLLKHDDEESDEGRKIRTRDVNPRYILRNWIAQRAIDKAEQDDFSLVQSLLQILRRPYEDQPEADAAGYASEPPSWGKNKGITCST